MKLAKCTGCQLDQITQPQGVVCQSSYLLLRSSWKSVLLPFRDSARAWASSEPMPLLNYTRYQLDQITHLQTMISQGLNLPPNSAGIMLCSLSETQLLIVRVT